MTFACQNQNQQIDIPIEMTPLSPSLLMHFLVPRWEFQSTQIPYCHPQSRAFEGWIEVQYAK
jgi:hypothetical protein